MTCTLCQDPRCDADAAHEDHDGLTDWIATARAMDRCRVTLADQVEQLRDRALRAEAEVAAFCPERRSDGLLAVMADAVADVLAAEGER